MYSAYSAVNLDTIRKNGRGNAINVGGWICICGYLLSAGFLLLAAIVNGVQWAVMGGVVFLVTTFLAAVSGWYFVNKSAGQTNRVVGKSIEALEAEFKRKDAAPAALPEPAPTPALPAAPKDDSFVWNHDGVGERVPKNLLHGFDPRDLAYVCRLLARGGKWTEAVLEKVELPYSGDVFGKAEKGTVYYRLFDATEGLFIRAGIIIERGGAGNKMGKLTTTDAGEMMTKIKALGE